MDPQFEDQVKEEVWQTVQAVNRAWTTGQAQELQHYFHLDMVAITPTDPKRWEGQAACLAGWIDFANTARIHSWQELEPRIQLYGTTAVVTYYYEMSFDLAGRTIVTSGRDMMVLVKEEGRWWVVADQYSGYPKAQDTA